MKLSWKTRDGRRDILAVLVVIAAVAFLWWIGGHRLGFDTGVRQ